jgi:hypothetical protein
LISKVGKSNPLPFEQAKTIWWCLLPSSKNTCDDVLTWDHQMMAVCEPSNTRKLQCCSPSSL